jgi:hypothetical protein
MTDAEGTDVPLQILREAKNIVELQSCSIPGVSKERVNVGEL